MFFFNDTATTEIYTLSLHDALPISDQETADTADLLREIAQDRAVVVVEHDMTFVRDLGVKVTVLHEGSVLAEGSDRKSTRLNSSHANISYAVFCLKKKKK